MKMELTIETAATERELQPADALAQYMPLVKATARRYEGRGAEYEDLVQEGCVALLRLTPACPDHRWLAVWLKNRLPGCVRAAAARLRGQKPNGAAGLEELEEVVSDGEADCEFAEREFAASLEPLLEPQELALVRTLMDGGIVPGFPLGRYYKGLENALLICCTEKHDRADIDRLARRLENAI